MTPEMVVVPAPVWRPRWRILADDIARRHGLTFRQALARGRGPRGAPAMAARIEIAHALDAEGHTSTQIGRWMHRDHTTVLLYLGRLKKRRKLP
jgi:hypothetical protein